MATAFEQHPGFDTHSELQRQPEQVQQPQSPEDIARISVSLAFHQRGETGVNTAPNRSLEAETSARIIALNHQQRALRNNELQAA